MGVDDANMMNVSIFRQGTSGGGTQGQDNLCSISFNLPSDAGIPLELTDDIQGK